MYVAKASSNYLRLRKDIINPLRDKVVISTREGHYFIEKSDIDFLEAQGNYCEIHYQGGKKLLFSKTMKHLSEQLLANNFIKVHQSFMINLLKIKHIDARFCHLTLSCGTQIPIARSKKMTLKRILKNQFD